MKISSSQIITVVVAFLVGVTAATFAVRDKKGEEFNENNPVKVDTAEEQANEATVEEETGGTVTPGTTTATTKTTTATTTKLSSEFVTGKCSTGLSGRKDDKLNAIVLNWSPCASEDFQFYKLVKSSKNASPSYPADGVAFSSANKNVANFVDKTVASRTTYYYRMCVIQRLGQVNCSNVATVSF